MTSEPTRFIADAMLGSLARKLRIFGFDTLYFREGSDAELEMVARTETRIILTSDRALLEHAVRAGLPALMMSGKGDRARLESLIAQADDADIGISSLVLFALVEGHRAQLFQVGRRRFGTLRGGEQPGGERVGGQSRGTRYEVPSREHIALL